MRAWCLTVCICGASVDAYVYVRTYVRMYIRPHAFNYCNGIMF